MSYIDGFVVPVPAGNKDAYLSLSETMTAIFFELGATRVVEAWESDVPDGKVTDFRRAVQAKEDEKIVFSWIAWPSKEARDEGNRRLMADPRMKDMGATMPFDGRRMIFGGFDVALDKGA
ncbi:MAG TPA: DUF1428 domain-containing protein [Beijerinckiaceae bacterium]